MANRSHVSEEQHRAVRCFFSPDFTICVNTVSTLLQSLENILLCLLCFGLVLFACIILHVRKLTQYNQPDCTGVRIMSYMQNLYPPVLSLVECDFTKERQQKHNSDLKQTQICS